MVVLTKRMPKTLAEGGWVGRAEIVIIGNITITLHIHHLIRMMF